MPKIGDSAVKRRRQPGKKAMGLGFKKPCSLAADPATTVSGELPKLAWKIQ